MELNELLNRISREQENYSPSQKLVADYVLKNYKRIPFFSITTLSKKIGVSHYSVISFCKSLGYSKFSEFKKDLSKYASDLIIYNKLSQNQEQEPEGTACNHGHFFDQTMAEDQKAIQATLANPANRVRGWPERYLLVSFGLSHRSGHPRVASCVEAYPGRWTHHVVVTRAEELDGELMALIDEAYRFSMVK